MNSSAPLTFAEAAAFDQYEGMYSELVLALIISRIAVLETGAIWVLLVPAKAGELEGVPLWPASAPVPGGVPISPSDSEGRPRRALFREFRPSDIVQLQSYSVDVDECSANSYRSQEP